jgi:uncharacterized RDD family membrane protein YckC
LRSLAKARYSFTMSEREPALLGDQAEDGVAERPAALDLARPGDPSEADTRPTAVPSEPDTSPTAVPSEPDTSPTARPSEPAVRPSTPTVRPSASTVDRVEPPARPSRREPPSVFVVGFWKRLAAAVVDLAIVIPAALVMTLIASKLLGVNLPPSNLKVFDVDMWIDLVLATDPALVMGLVMLVAIGMIYLLVFQIVVGRTLGMRLLRIKIIDVYGDRPSPARCVARCAGYLAGVATLFLGFLWMGFDSEKRGLQDWIAGTYVIRA